MCIHQQAGHSVKYQESVEYNQEHGIKTPNTDWDRPESAHHRSIYIQPKTESLYDQRGDNRRIPGQENANHRSMRVATRMDPDDGYRGDDVYHQENADHRSMRVVTRLEPEDGYRGDAIIYIEYILRGN